jgi:hypothetical protein
VCTLRGHQYCSLDCILLVKNTEEAPYDNGHQCFACGLDLTIECAMVAVPQEQEKEPVEKITKEEWLERNKHHRIEMRPPGTYGKKEHLSDLKRVLYFLH